MAAVEVRLTGLVLGSNCVISDLLAATFLRCLAQRFLYALEAASLRTLRRLEGILVVVEVGRLGWFAVEL